jgi:hypothetical protein
MNLNEQLREAYEDGRRQGLNEYIVNRTFHYTDNPSPKNWTARGGKWKMWQAIIDAYNNDNRTLLRRLLKQAIKTGICTELVAGQLLGASSWAAFSAILVASLPYALILALIAAGIAFPGFRGIDPDVEFGGAIPDWTLRARHPVSVSNQPGGKPPVPHH